MSINDVFIVANNNTYSYEGEDAEKVYKAINDAGARGAEWTTPVKVGSGYNVVFVIKNIVYFGYK